MYFLGFLKGRVFLGGAFADFQGSSQLLTSSHLRERDKMLLRAILCGSAKKEDVPCRFCGKRDGDGRLFWECTFPPFLHVRELPEFASLMSLDRGRWPRCLLWRGWLVLAAVMGGVLGLLLSVSWLAWSWRDAWVLIRWTALVIAPPDYWDVDDIAVEMSDYPNIWTDGSRDDCSSIGDFEVAGAGVYLLAAEVAFDGAVWEVSEEYGDARLERCRAFLLVPGVMQTVQRAEFWLALSFRHRMLLGLLDDCWIRTVWLSLCPWLRMGTWFALVQYMIRTRGRETVRVTKGQGSCHRC